MEMHQESYAQNRYLCTVIQEKKLTMKKYLLLATLWIVTCCPVLAQGYVKGSHFLDHWYVGAHSGFNSKLTHNAFMSHLNPHTTLRLGRDLVPAFGLMVEATSFYDDQVFGNSPCFIKAFNFDLLGQLNLNNLIRGYAGYRRFCEVRFLAGMGVNHICGIEGNSNDLISKVGFDVAFRLDCHEAWEAYVEPALNFNLNRYSSTVQYNPHHAAWQLAFGVNYYFRNVDGTRRFRRPVADVALVEPMPRSESKRERTQQLSVDPKESVTLVATTPEPSVKIEPAEPVVVKTETPEPVITEPVFARPKVKTEAPSAGERSSAGLPVITFVASSDAIPNSEYDHMAQVAVYLRNHPRAKLVIHGTKERSKAVSDMLVRRYGVVSNRLSVSAQANAKAVTFTEK